MAKRRRRIGGKSVVARRGRDLSIPKLITSRPLYPTRLRRVIPMQDRRLWSPYPPLRVVRQVSGERAKLQPLPKPSPLNRLRFMPSRTTTICVRRRRRREVLFSRGVAGSGAKQRRRKRNIWSNVSCK
mgnify:CR=1 FL=1